MKLFSSLSKKQLHNKIVLLRVDLNVHHEDTKYSLRVVRAIETIRFIRSRGARVVILSHKGRPVRQIPNSKFQIPNKLQKSIFKENSELSLKPFVQIFKKALREEVVFIPEVIQGKKIIEASSAHIFMCENIRFWEGEEKNSPIFAQKLAGMGDIYVNDAFADSHRAHASVSAITRYIDSYAGPSLEREVRMLASFRSKSVKHPLVAIIGGAKAADKIELLDWFIHKADSVLTGGGVANTFLAWCGYEVGTSVRDKDISVVNKFSRYPVVHIPYDTVIAKGKILDIGKQSVRFYTQEISRARAVIWNGPVGDTDLTRFKAGSRALWRAILRRSKQGQFTALIGGGETTSFVLKETNTTSSIPQNIFLSTGGGAMLAYLTGKKLPGIEALD